MKRKLKVALACVLMLTLLCSATSFAASISGPGKIETGATINVTISGDGIATSGNVRTEGLSFIGIPQQQTLSTQNAFIVIADAGGMSETYTYKVTAQPGERAAVSLTNVKVVDKDENESSAASASWSLEVAPEATQPPATPTTEPPTETPQVTTAPPTVTPTMTPPTAPTESPSTAPEPTTTESAVIPTGETSNNPTASGGAGIVSPQPSGTPKPPSGDSMPKTADASHLWVLAVLATMCVAIVLVAWKKIRATQQ